MPVMLPGPYRSPYADTIARLMMRQGDIAAAGAERQGQIWGNAVANLGQIGAQAYQQHQEAKQQKARTAALDEFVQSGVWAQDPKLAVAGAVKILGPEQGVKFAEGLVGAAQIGNAKTVAEAQKALPMVARGFLAAPDDLKPKLYGHTREMMINAGLADPGDMPEQWTPELAPFVQAIAGNDATSKTRTVEVLNADGSKTVKIVEDKPGQEFTSAPEPKPTQPRVVGRSLVDDKGHVIYRDPESAGDKPKMYEVEVPGPNGTLVKKLVTEAELRAGVTMAPKSVGNKPVTGAERQALAFHNRAAEALRTAEPLETSIAKYGVVDQQRLAADGKLSNYLQSDEMQAYRQAQRAFTEARLRKESGAAIPKEEYLNDARTYFAQPGDSQKTIKQKQEARRKVLEGLAYSAGKAYDEYYGEPFKRSGAAPADEKKADPLGIR